MASSSQPAAAAAAAAAVHTARGSGRAALSGRPAAAEEEQSEGIGWVPQGGGAGLLDMDMAGMQRAAGEPWRLH